MDKPNDLMLNHIAARFKALSDPTRLRLLMALQAGEHPVGALADIVGAQPASTSKHLAILRQVGLVAVRREGNVAFYRTKDEEVYQLCELMCAGVSRFISSEQAALQ